LARTRAPAAAGKTGAEPLAVPVEAFADAPAERDGERALRSLADWALRGPLEDARRLALTGPAGCGKSVALARLSAGVRAAGQGRVAFAQASALGAGAPAALIAASVHAALTAPDAPEGFVALAEEAAQDGALSAGDAQEAARIAGDRLIDARRRLEAERRALHDLNARLARASEVALFQDGGSRVDSWARAHRASLERRLRAFGFDAHDTVASFKDLVRDVADRRGALGRTSVYLHALWGFRGQTRLLVWGALFWFASLALSAAQASQRVWLGWMRNAGEATALIANALAPHVGWLGFAASAAGWLALACLALNLWRAVRFVGPLTRAAAMYEADVRAAQRELETAIGQQTRLVDALGAECETCARSAEAAERRAARQGQRDIPAASPFGDGRADAGAQARAYLASLSRTLALAPAGAPERVIVALDDLDARPPHEAAAFVDEAARLLSQGPFVLIAAAHARRLAHGWSGGLGEQEGRDRFAACFQAALRVSAPEPALLGALARDAGAAAPRAFAPLDLAAPLHAQALAQDELDRLARLAPLIARTPAQARRFAIAYRLARPRNVAPAALAGALAVTLGCAREERAALEAALAARSGATTISLRSLSAGNAGEVLRAALGDGEADVAQLRSALTAAADYAPEA
jgi:hypothetical protein